MSRDPISERLARMNAGERRPTARTVVVELPVTVTIEWPEGITYSDAVAKEVATSAVSTRYGRDVGPLGTIVWAECSAECCDDEATVIEGGESDGHDAD